MIARGRRLLIAVLQMTPAVEVAARCGVHKSNVSRWLAGYQTPCDVARARLQSIYGIPASAWGSPAIHSSTVRHKHQVARVTQRPVIDFVRGIVATGTRRTSGRLGLSAAAIQCA
jgi:transcriptional regulator with XRE-family HTH domain